MPEITQPQVIEKQFWVGLGVITLVGVALAFAFFGFSMRWDEPFTANIINQSWEGLITDLQVDPGGSAPLSYFALKAWRDLFGESALALRSMSIIYFAMSIVLIGLSGRRLFGWQGGLIAATLLALNTSIAHPAASNVRHYSLLLLLIVAALWIIVRWLPSDVGAMSTSFSLRSLVALTAISVLGLSTHQTYLLVIGAYTAASLVISRRLFVHLSVSTVIALGIYLLLLGPALLWTLGSQTTAWLAAPTLRDLFEAYRLLWGTLKSGLIAVAIVIIFILNFKDLRSFIKDQRLLFAGVSVILLSIGVFVLSQFVQVFHASRTPLLFLPVACLLVTQLITHWKTRWVALPLLLTLTVFAFGSAYRTATQPELIPASSSLRGLTEQLECGDSLVAGLAYSELVYYLRQFEVDDCIAIEVFPAQVIDHPGWMDTAGLLAETTTLETEVAALVDKIQSDSQRVWYFVPVAFDQHDAIGEFMQAALDRTWNLDSTFDWQGTYFGEVYLYQQSQDAT